MNKYELIIFDWDGTLMDSAGKIVTCMQGAAKLANLPIPTDEEVKHIIGISLVPAIKQLFSLSSLDEAEHVADCYKKVFVESDHVASPLFNGTTQLLQDLANQNRRLAVATGKARRGLDRAWTQTNTGQYFVTSRCADEAKSKPSPDMLLQILDELDIHSSKAVMIGDTSYDMAMAAEIGMDRIGVSYGAHTTDKLIPYDPKALVDDVAELMPYLL